MPTGNVARTLARRRRERQPAQFHTDSTYASEHFGAGAAAAAPPPREEASVGRTNGSSLQQQQLAAGPPSGEIAVAPSLPSFHCSVRT